MIAKFDGLDYHIFLEKPKHDIDVLAQASLEAPLMDLEEKEFNVRVRVEIGDNSNPDGAELAFVPPSARRIEDIRYIKITINDSGYALLRRGSEIYTTYGRTENKLRIVHRHF